jgi:ABC-type multidrug transport system fused ATPase/permease subunit
MRDRTTIVISHRMSSVIKCDKIIVLKHGAIVETGQHEDLMQNQGEYFEQTSTQIEADSLNSYTVSYSDMDTAQPYSTKVIEEEKEEEEETQEEEEDLDLDLGEQKVASTLPFIRVVGIEWITVLLGIGAAIMAGLTLPAVYVVFGKIIQSVTPSRDLAGNIVPFPLGYSMTSEVQKFAAIFLIVAVLAGFAELVKNMAAAIANARLQRRILDIVFRAIISMEIGFFDNVTVGKLMTVLLREVQTISEGLSSKMLIFIEFVTLCVTCLVLGMYYSWKMSLVLLGTGLPLHLFFTFLAYYNEGKMNEQVYESTTAVNNIASEVIGSIRTVRSMGGEEKETQRFKEEQDRINQVCMRSTIMTAISYGTY